MEGSGKRSDEDTRATWVKGYAISSQVITIALELILPGLLGFFADRWLGIFPVLTVTGLFFGLTTGTVHFIHFAKTLNHPQKRGSNGMYGTHRDGE